MRTATRLHWAFVLLIRQTNKQICKTLGNKPLQQTFLLKDKLSALCIEFCQLIHVVGGDTNNGARGLEVFALSEGFHWY